MTASARKKRATPLRSSPEHGNIIQISSDLPMLNDDTGLPTVNHADDAPESPMTKKLAEELESRDHRRLEENVHVAKMLSRPKSSGNDIDCHVFSKPGPMVKTAITQAKQPIISFAPKQLPTTDPVKPAPIITQAFKAPSATSMKALETEVAINVPTTEAHLKKESITALMIEHSPVPPVSTESLTAEPIVPQCIPVYAAATEETQKSSSSASENGLPHSYQIPVPSIEAEKQPDLGVQPEEQEIDQDMTESAHIVHQNEASADETGASVERPAREPSDSASALPPFRTPRSHRSRSSVLSLAGQRPSRVVKSGHHIPRQHIKHSKQDNPYIPTDDEIYMVLAYRHKTADENLSKARNQIRALQENNRHLKKEYDRVMEDVAQLRNENAETTERNDQLQEEVEVGKTKYYKLKDFARKFSTELSSLRKMGQQQAFELQQTRKAAEEYQAALGDARSNMSQVEDLVQKRGKSLKDARSEVKLVFQSLTQQQTLLQEKTSQLREEKYRNSRFENHVIKLRASQQRNEKSSQADAKSLLEWMNNVGKKLGSIELVMSDPSTMQSSDACQRLVEQLQRNPPLVAQDFKDVTDALVKLQGMVQTGAGDINRSLRALDTTLTKPDNASPLPVLDEVRQSLDALKPDLASMATAESRIVSLTAELKGRDVLIKELKQHQSASTLTVRQALSTNDELVKQKQDAVVEEQFRLRYTSAKSNLAQESEKLKAALEAKKEVGKKLQDTVSQLEDMKLTLARAQEDVTSAREIHAAEVEAEIAEERSRCRQEIRALELELELAGMEAAVDAETAQQLHTVISGLQDDSLMLTSQVEKSQSETTDAKAKLTDAVSRIGDLERTELELKQTQDQLKQANENVRKLQPLRAQKIQLDHEVKVLKQGIANKDSTLANLTRDIDSLRSETQIIPKLQHALDEYEKAKATMTAKLAQVQAEADELPKLQAQIDAQTTTLTTLESENTRLRACEIELQSSNAERDRKAQELVETKNNLHAAQIQIDANADIAAQLQTKIEEFSLLQQQLQGVKELQTTMATLQEESQRKDSQIIDLTSEITRLKEESQELGVVRSDESQPAFEPIGSFLSQDDPQAQCSILEQLVATPELHDASQSRQTNPGQEVDPPRRRVADRTASIRPRSLLLAQASLEIRDSQTGTQRTDVVPDSQQLGTPSRRQLEEASAPTSPLSELLSELTENAQITGNTALDNELEIPESLPVKAGYDTRPPLVQSRPDFNLLRPPSSALSEDLFTKHEDFLGTQQGLIAIHGHPATSLSRPIIKPSELDLVPPESGQRSQPYISPRKLRNGTEHGSQLQARDSNNGYSASKGLRPEPNSAAKRSADDDSQQSEKSTTSKRRKRNVENMQVPSSQRSTSLQTMDSNVPSLRRSGSNVVGSKAPTPGHTRRAKTKLGKKGSSSDKHAAMFGSGSPAANGS